MFGCHWGANFLVAISLIDSRGLVRYHRRTRWSTVLPIGSSIPSRGPVGRRDDRPCPPGKGHDGSLPRRHRPSAQEPDFARASRSVCIIPTANPSPAPTTVNQGPVFHQRSPIDPRSGGRANSRPMVVARDAQSMATARLERDSGPGSDRLTQTLPRPGLEPRRFGDRTNRPTPPSPPSNTRPATIPTGPLRERRAGRNGSRATRPETLLYPPRTDCQLPSRPIREIFHKVGVVAITRAIRVP
jgi:hypothetical protein